MSGHSVCREERGRYPGHLGGSRVKWEKSKPEIGRDAGREGERKKSQGQEQYLVEYCS